MIAIKLHTNLDKTKHNINQMENETTPKKESL